MGKCLGQVAPPSWLNADYKGNEGLQVQSPSLTHSLLPCDSTARKPYLDVVS